MRVGGVQLDVNFVRRVFIGIILAFVLISILVSASAAILLVTSFCFGATLLSIALDLSPGHQFPNLISHWKGPKLCEEYQCSQCPRTNCIVHLEHEPFAGFKVPIEVDKALENFVERLLNEYVYLWYREISYDEDFVQEIRQVLRHAIAILCKRLCRVDLTDLIIKRVIPIGLCHVDALIHAENFIKSEKNTRKLNMELRDAYVDYLGPRIHPAALNRVKELEYVQSVVASLVPYLLPPRYLSSKTMTDLINDILFGAVLQPVLDLIGNPDATANLLIGLAFDPSPSRKFGPGSGQKVELLKQFVRTHQTSQKSALHIDMSTILKNETSLFAFMNFLKEKQAIDQLHFCLAVEEFNKKIMNPELSEEAMQTLHNDALTLYNLHFKPDAEHKVPVNIEYVNEIKSILDGPMSNVVLLRSTPPLFKAYEEVYSILESKYCPSFFKSEEYFTFLLGKREVEAPEGSEKTSSKTKDLNVKAGEKLNKGLHKLKHGVLGKSMEGIIDAPADPAFDMIDICANNEEDEEDDIVDETLTSKGFNPLFEYRDLSAWRVHISKVATHRDVNGKNSFFFVIEVQRIDITSTKENAEDLQWTVLRKYSEFYTLETRLTEFHGEFEDLNLPPKASLFTGKGLDVLQAKIKPFEEYLAGLLKKPFLKESDILFTFLTSNDEFTMASSTLGVGKIINKVNPMKLTTKERGQNLQPFIDNFVASTLSSPSKPRADSVIGGNVDHDDYTNHEVEFHSIFGNNFGLKSLPKHGPAFTSVEKNKIRQDKGTFDVIFYLVATLFKASLVCLHLLHGVGILVRKSFDHLVDYGIRTKLASVLCCNRIAYLIKMIESSVFEPPGPSVTEKEKLQRKEEALENFQTYLRSFIQPLCGKQKYENGTQFVFDALQDPVLNKQLTYVLVDVILEELFPDLSKKSLK